ncbi:NADH:flavin oxidoreductase/NADH oxidase [Arthrobacter sp. NQ7]|uniref:NADH:flavin oxidoreductase/NADH oxidase n=1 Tax=Arthrobacter sp. NQ7 TaxID=3032303 RepID=UPI002410641D|nr:NADH:flavin oxidoreductase/NADH oxidase [Arthrobacter sp. NQ7]MDJ0460026.1 NADH:flavin oxidoreductase/NADH oxidase [Arthrobacter sp. NQ7]
MTTDSLLFTPYRLGGMDLKNRIVMSPMLMYQAANDGTVTPRQVLHYGARALGGVGLIMTEVIAVHPQGRISESDIGLWSDEHIAGVRRIVDAVHACDAKIGVQLAHSGRKAQLPGGCVAPSPIPHSEDSATPAELTTEEVRHLVQYYGAAAVRADQAEVDCIQIHAAHGYLIHEFLAPMSNQRSDEYGGSLENRARFLLEVVRKVREALPASKPLLVRFSGTDLIEGGVTADEAAQLAKWLEAEGADLLEVTSGNITSLYGGDVYPGYQVKFVQDIRRQSSLPLASVGSIHSADLAEYLLRDGGIDLVFIGRALLRDPFWPIHAAADMGMEPPLPIPTYTRSTGPYHRGF